MKKKDILLAGGILLLALALFLWMRMTGNREGATLRVLVDGKVYGVYSLGEDQVISIDQERGLNVLVIREGQAYMEEADCPDQYCVKQGKIHKKGQSIVCLPHRLSATVEGEEEGEPESGSPGDEAPKGGATEGEEPKGGSTEDEREVDAVTG